MPNYPRPSWTPTFIPTFDWTLDHLKLQLSGKHFTIFKNGTCVIWPGGLALSEAECIATLNSVVMNHPDFKVRRSGTGDFLVTFKGGVGGIMCGELLRQNYDILRLEALSIGLLPHEKIKSEKEDAVDDDLDLIAGLIVRARLYIDAELPVIARVEKSGT